MTLERWKPWNRAVAIGYIALIILGNVWLTYAMVAHPTPTWFHIASKVAIGFTVVATFCLFLSK